METCTWKYTSSLIWYGDEFAHEQRYEKQEKLEV